VDSLFWFKCSADLAQALGAIPRRRIPRPDLSFPVYEPVRTHHATICTEEGHFAWLWELDPEHPFIEVR
jgi:hypothetical protein